MSRRVHPFAEQGNFTAAHNYVWDTLLRELSPAGWKVLCHIIRKTIGWQVDEVSRTYEQLMEGTGIKGRSTIAAAVAELVNRNLIIATSPEREREPTRYALNRAYEGAADDGSPKTGLREVRSPKNELRASSISGLPASSVRSPEIELPIKERILKKTSVKESARTDVFLRLSTMEFTEDQAAEIENLGITSGDVMLLEAWIASHKHGEEGVKNPHAVALSKLRQGELPFMAGDSTEELATEQRKRDAAATQRDAARFRPQPAPQPPPFPDVPSGAVGLQGMAHAFTEMRQKRTWPSGPPPNPYRTGGPDE